MKGTLNKGAALVLGGGFAGLSAAIHLALAGFEVTLLEGHAEAGGKAGEITGEGFRFDTGPSVLTLPGVLEAVFAAAGENLPFTLNPSRSPLPLPLPVGPRVGCLPRCRANDGPIEPGGGAGLPEPAR